MPDNDLASQYWRRTARCTLLRQTMIWRDHEKQSPTYTYCHYPQNPPVDPAKSRLRLEGCDSDSQSGLLGPVANPGVVGTARRSRPGAPVAKWGVAGVAVLCDHYEQWQIIVIPTRDPIPPQPVRPGAASGFKGATGVRKAPYADRWRFLGLKGQPAATACRGYGRERER